jgi:hypothetical protein
MRGSSLAGTARCYRACARRRNTTPKAQRFRYDAIDVDSEPLPGGKNAFIIACCRRHRRAKNIRHQTPSHFDIFPDLN